MPRKPPTPCTFCGKPVVRQGKCAEHIAKGFRHVDSKRGTASQRGYTSAGHLQFRDGVLRKDGYRCVICGDVADTADHYPRSRKELIAAGLDPNDPQYGRALCTRDHNVETGKREGNNNFRRRHYK